MRRAFVALPDGVWKIIDRDFKNKMGAGDSEALRNIIISYLSDQGYFVNPKGESEKEELEDKIRILEEMITGLTDVLQSRGYITTGEWDKAVNERVQSLAKKIGKRD